MVVVIFIIGFCYFFAEDPGYLERCCPLELGDTGTRKSATRGLWQKQDKVRHLSEGTHVTNPLRTHQNQRRRNDNSDGGVLSLRGTRQPD